MTSDVEVDELAELKKLMVLGLIRAGLTQNQVAGALGIHRTSLARMFPTGVLTEVARGSKNSNLESADE